MCGVLLSVKVPFPGREHVITESTVLRDLTICIFCFTHLQWISVRYLIFPIPLCNWGPFMQNWLLLLVEKEVQANLWTSNFHYCRPRGAFSYANIGLNGRKPIEALPGRTVYWIMRLLKSPDSYIIDHSGLVSYHNFCLNCRMSIFFFVISEWWWSSSSLVALWHSPFFSLLTVNDTITWSWR